MTTSEITRPATSAAGHLALGEELRDQIRERLLGLLDQTQRRLDRELADPEAPADRAEVLETAEAIRSALVKLEAGYYGVCERCEGPIPFERLEALPAARACVACQTRPRSLLG